MLSSNRLTTRQSSRRTIQFKENGEGSGSEDEHLDKENNDHKFLGKEDNEAKERPRIGKCYGSTTDAPEGLRVGGRNRSTTGAKVRRTL